MPEIRNTSAKETRFPRDRSGQLRFRKYPLWWCFLENFPLMLIISVSRDQYESISFKFIYVQTKLLQYTVSLIYTHLPNLKKLCSLLYYLYDKDTLINNNCHKGESVIYFFIFASGNVIQTQLRCSLRKNVNVMRIDSSFYAGILKGAICFSTV